MWIGIVIGFVGFVAGFFGLRARFLQEGSMAQVQRQESRARMITKAVKQTDLLIDRKMDQKIKQIRAVSRMRREKPKKTLRDARKLLLRTKAWPPKQ